MFLFVFMLICSLIVPFTMIIFGSILKNDPPKTINNAYGYRTAMSKKNIDTWIFANKLCGKIWVKSGLAMLPVTVITMLLFMHNSENTIGLVGTLVCVIQCLILMLTIPTVEKQLKKNFDEFGRKKA